MVLKSREDMAKPKENDIGTKAMYKILLLVD